MNRIVTALAALGAIALAGCTTTFEVANIDPATGRFAVNANDAIPASAISTRKAFDVDGAKQVLFVRSNLGVVESYDAYFEKQIERLGFFGQVLRKDEFERFLIQQGKAQEVASVDGFVGLSQAAKAIGRFLVVDFDVEGDVGYQVRLKMAVYDPADATELLVVNHQVTNWAGLDGVLFQPALNVLIDWIKENSTTYAPPPAPAEPQKKRRSR